MVNHMTDSGAKYTLRLAHLYPTLMNLYGDRGNIITLRRRCEARGIALEIDDIGLGDDFDRSRYDLIFVGGGQDREQKRIADDLVERKGPGLRAAVEEGVPTLAVCGGYQLLGRSYQPGAGEELPGVGIFPMRSVHAGEDKPRCIGNVEAEWELGTLVGFENHGGRTYLDPGATPLAHVRSGYGNNGEDGTEGIVVNNAFGTYLHGSLLPKNPALADHLIGLALQRKYGDDAVLPPLDDTLELRAHEAAAAVARRDAQPARRLPSWLRR
jgi:lipid II isoglutaminyl synthase (glutamine-hydrolysing)